MTLAKEFLGHTRMNRWGIVGFAHWFVAVGFLTLPPTLVKAYGQLFQADWTLPVIGGFLPYEMYIEFIGADDDRSASSSLIVDPAAEPARPGRAASPASPAPRPGQAYFVEYVILIIGLAILTLRGLEGAHPPRRPLRGRVLRLVPAGRRLQGPERSARCRTWSTSTAMIKIGDLLRSG